MYPMVNYQVLPMQGSLYPALSQAHPIFSGATLEAAQNLGLPLPLISLTALSAIAAALQGILKIEVPNGTTLPVSLNALITVPSGGGKNRTANLFKKPFEDFEEAQIKVHLEERSNYKTRLEVWSYEPKELTTTARKSSGKQTLVDLLLGHDQRKPIAPRSCRIIFEDTTPEALLACMAEGGKNAWLVTSEGGIVLSQHAMKNMPALNQLWSGDRVTVDRKTGDSFSLVDTRISVLIMSQPGVFESFFNHCGALARESGFFARCLTLAIPQDMLGQLVDDRVLEWSHLQVFNENISNFLKMTLYGAERINLRLAPEAQRHWIAIKNAVKWEQRQGGRFDDFHDLAARTPENILRIAALLHFFEGRSGDVSAETLDFSCRLCFWHADQFCHMFSERSSGDEDARVLYEWFITRYKKFGITAYRKNDVRQRCPGALRKDGRFDAAFEVLLLRGFLTLQKYGNGITGVSFYPQGGANIYS
jgi:hypothetical protein